MASFGGDPLLVTDSDIHALTWEFLNSGYGGDEYAHWPLERRLHGFLRRRGLSRHADNGDICNIIIDRVMTYISVRGRGGSIASVAPSEPGAPTPEAVKNIATAPSARRKKKSEACCLVLEPACQDSQNGCDAMPVTSQDESKAINQSRSNHDS
jgi:hypothetical protein